MMQAIQDLATVAGLLLIIAVSMWAILSMAGSAYEAWKQSQRLKHNEPVLLWKMPHNVREMNDWCSWYFPIVEDFANYLMKRADGTGGQIDEFREQLFRKYGKRETTPVGPPPDPKGEPEPRYP